MGYAENSIRAIEMTEHVRMRPAMYLGTTKHSGILELLDNVMLPILQNRPPSVFGIQ